MKLQDIANDKTATPGARKVAREALAALNQLAQLVDDLGFEIEVATNGRDDRLDGNAGFFALGHVDRAEASYQKLGCEIAGALVRAGSVL